jgi:hypothetical protein
MVAFASDWVMPQLVVLTRGTAEEQVLVNCKGTKLSKVTGGSADNHKGCLVLGASCPGNCNVLGLT